MRVITANFTWLIFKIVVFKLYGSNPLKFDSCFLRNLYGSRTANFRTDLLNRNS